MERDLDLILKVEIRCVGRAEEVWHIGVEAATSIRPRLHEGGHG